MQKIIIFFNISLAIIKIQSKISSNESMKKWLKLFLRYKFSCSTFSVFRRWWLWRCPLIAGKWSTSRGPADSIGFLIKLCQCDMYMTNFSSAFLVSIKALFFLDRFGRSCRELILLFIDTYDHKRVWKIINKHINICLLQ